ncbi:hypothetical protein JAO29_10380 [Edaphobacter sp. HDX4]|uniref:hypothetical protein n=1 Tax=Edaphobacter sp. HDX4 TaxID=2794064 RepID=UPI002FE65A0B
MATLALRSILQRFVLPALALAPLLCTPSAFATPPEPVSVASSTSDLPNSPGALLKDADSSSSSAVDAPPSSFFGQTAAAGGQSTVRPFVKLVPAGQSAAPQTAMDKVRLGFRESVTPFSMLGWVASAGWSHLIDSSPNYGTNSEAFGQRLGASAALGSSKEIFSDAILAPVFHQDPRYYQRGAGHKLINRALYAGSRPIIGRTDSGKTIPNYATMLGTAGAAALTQTYYPERNVSGAQIARTWASSLGGSAVGYLVSEFGGEVIRRLHITKEE